MTLLPTLTRKEAVGPGDAVHLTSFDMGPGTTSFKGAWKLPGMGSLKRGRMADQIEKKLGWGAGSLGAIAFLPTSDVMVRLVFLPGMSEIKACLLLSR